MNRPTIASPPEHTLSSDLVKLCLPRAQNDPNRRLAWVNSICLLFLVIGTVGLKPPTARTSVPAETVNIVPVILAPAPPAEPPKPTVTPEQPNLLEPADALPVDRPVVATVVAADVSSVAFAVPVEGPVILAAVRFAAPPPRAIEAPPAASKPTQYVPSEEDWGGHPRPDYPPLALRRGYQGKVVLEIDVDPSGAVSLVKVAESSGYKILDDTALEHVRKHLRLRRPPGETRLHTIDIIFQLKP